MTYRQQRPSFLRFATPSGALAFVALILAGLLTASLAQAQTYTNLYSFTGPGGSNPYSGLIRDSAGNLYGTASSGGSANEGVIFRIEKNGKENVLFSFTGVSTGYDPTSTLLADETAGVLYGTAAGGGDPSCPQGDQFGCGAVFKLSKTGKYTILYSFTGGADGAFPFAGLIKDSAGNLYGTTQFGGDLSCGNQASGCGTVFEISPSGQEATLHAFAGGSDGSGPYYGTLLRDTAGNFYGVTVAGGSSNCGVVYQIAKNGAETILHNFAGGTTDGCVPIGALIEDNAGNLYGTASTHGAGTGYVAGVVFKLSKDGSQYNILHTFTGQPDGDTPEGGLIRDAAGNLYGTTEFGGTAGAGTVYELNNQGSLTVLYNFTGSSDDGAYPYDTLLGDPAKGVLYGTTAFGGVDFQGTIFSLKK